MFTQIRVNLRVIYKIIFVITFITGAMFSNTTSADVIEKLPSTTLITCNPTSIVFTGEEIKPCTATVTELGDSLLNESIHITYTNNINAGIATVNAAFDGDNIYSASFDEKTFTITPATPTFHYYPKCMKYLLGEDTPENKFKYLSENESNCYSEYDGTTFDPIDVNNVIVKGVNKILFSGSLSLGEANIGHRNASNYLDSFIWYSPGDNNYKTINNTVDPVITKINNIITKRPITVTAVTNTKEEDGNTTANAIPTITSGSLAEGDTATFTESYSDATIGENKTLTPTGIINDGNEGNNYEVTYVSINTGTISAVKKSTQGSSGSYVIGYLPNTQTTPIITPTSATEGKVLGAEKYNFTGYLKMWTYGNEVTELQRLLMGAGFDCTYIDGKYGPLTKAAVKKFQIANGLVGDGIVGEKTREILNK